MFALVRECWAEDPARVLKEGLGVWLGLALFFLVMTLI